MPRLKLWSARVESHDPVSVSNLRTIICTFLALPPIAMDEFSFKELKRGVNPIFYLVALVYGVTHKN